MFATKLKLGAAFFLVMSIVATGGAVTHSLLGARDEGRLQLVSERKSVPQARQSAEAAPEEISQVATPSDEQTLKESKIGGDGPALLEFLRQRTLAAQENNVASLVQRLGDSSFASREKATAELVAVGAPAVPPLCEAGKDTDAEAARRASGCLRRIHGGREGALPAAVVRLVAARRPAGAAEALLNYLPVAYDDYVAEEARHSLTAVAQVNGKLERVLVDALSDRQSAARRAFAGEAICRAVGADQRQPVRKLLQDPVPGVRLRIALALATRKDRDAIPTLVEVLDKVPPAQARQAEDVLYRLAEENGPDLPFAADESSWGQRREAWTAWWRQHGPQVDLARLHMPANTLIVESSPGDKTTLVFEQAPDGKILWQLRPGSAVTDALVVPGRRVLLSEWKNLCVTERDFDGVILWKKQLATNPLFLQRLPDGHTFILDQEQVLEVDQAGKEVFHYKPANHIRRILAAQKLRDGQIVCFTYEGLIDPEGFPTSTYINRLDVNCKELKQCLIARNKKTKKDINDSIDFGGMDALANGHVLIAHHVSGRVVEYDGEGQAVWEAKVPWPVAPKRQPNGNTRVVIGVGANEKEGGLVELDRAGKTIWKVAVDLPGPSTHLANGHTLLIRHLFNPSGGKLLEIDRSGKVVWQYETKGSLGRGRR